MRQSLNEQSRPKINRSFTEINPFKHSPQKKTMNMLRGEDDVSGAVSPIKMMGGLEASQISS